MENNNKSEKRKASDLKRFQKLEAQEKKMQEAFDLEQAAYKEKRRKQDEEWKLQDEEWELMASKAAEDTENEIRKFNAIVAVNNDYRKNLIMLRQSRDIKQPTYNPTKLNISIHGAVNSKMLCQQCGEKGFIHTKITTRKVGVSGGKATAALLTAGLSLFAFGLSRKQNSTEAYCGNCNSNWYF